MTSIDPSIFHAAHRPNLADVPDPAAARKTTVQQMSMETAAHSQVAATRTLAQVQGSQQPGSQASQLPDTQNTTHGLNLELAAALAAERNPANDISIMVLMLKMKMNSAIASKQTRNAERDAQAAEQLKAVGDKKKAAGFRLAAGITGGIVQLGAGAVQAAGGARSATKSVQAMKSQNAASKLQYKAQEAAEKADEFSAKASDRRIMANANASKSSNASRMSTRKQLDAGKEMRAKALASKREARNLQQSAEAHQAEAAHLRHAAQALATNAEAASKLLGGMGELIGAGLKYAAEMSDIYAQKDEIAARLHETAAADAADAARSSTEVMQDILRSITSSSESNSRTLGNIAGNIR